jgi:hypothetical protein
MGNATTTIAGTPGTNSPTILQQIESFALFAVVIIGLGSFKKTHMIAIYILGIVALVIVLKYASGNYTAGG